MKYLKINVILLYFLLTACGSTRPITKYENEVIALHSKAAYDKRGWLVTCTGGEGPTDIIKITICYTTSERADLATLRRYFFESADDLIAKMNSHMLIRPYLRDFPSTYQNIDLTISCYDDTTHRPYIDGKVCQVTMINNRLYYSTFDLVDYWKVVYEEDLEEALKEIQTDKG